MEAYWGTGSIAPCILELGIKWRWVVSFTPPSLYPHCKSPWFPLERRLGGPPEPFWTRWWREKFPAFAGIRSPDHPARSPELYRWAILAPHCHCSFFYATTWKENDPVGSATMGDLLCCKICGFWVVTPCNDTVRYQQSRCARLVV
jgi:hypothetical protein